jgi:F1F0 ATPase subunit 2
MSGVLAGFYFIGRGHWEKLLVCLLGFVMARVFVTRLTRAAQKPTYWAREASHAP